MNLTSAPKDNAEGGPLTLRKDPSLKILPSIIEFSKCTGTEGSSENLIQLMACNRDNMEPIKAESPEKMFGSRARCNKKD